MARMKLENTIIFVAVLIVLKSHLSLASIKMSYMSNMLLGRTFDYSKSIVGTDIYPATARTNAETKAEDHTRYQTEMEIVKSTKNVMDVLDISGQLTLKVLAGVVNIEGKGSYLKSSTESGETIELIAKTHVKTKTVTIKDEVNPIAGWETGKVTGQHYIRGITYGGYLIASMKFTLKKNAKKENVEASLDGRIEAAKLELSLKGLFQKLVEKNNDVSSLSITFTSTVIPDIVPLDEKGLLKAIEEFPKKLKVQNDGKGVPIEVELRDLGNLKTSKQNLFTLNKPVMAKTKDIASFYHDLKKTADYVAKAIENARLTDDMVTVYSEFNTKIWNISETFFAAIDNMDLSGDLSQFDAALDAYGRSSLIGKYMRKFDDLMVKYPLVEVDEYERIPLDLVEMRKSVDKQTVKLNSLRKLHSGNNVATSFNRRSVNDYLVARGSPKELSKMMACFSAKASITAKKQTFLSYSSTDGGYFYIRSIQGGKLKVKMSGSPASTFPNINMADNAWHAWCISWDTSGKLDVFKDNAKVATKSGIASGKMFKAGGVWIVGQDQGSAGGEFNAGQTFQGEIANVNIFEKSDEAFGLQASASKCVEPADYSAIVRSWKDFKLGRVGEVHTIDNGGCPTF